MKTLTGPIRTKAPEIAQAETRPSAPPADESTETLNARVGPLWPRVKACAGQWASIAQRRQHREVEEDRRARQLMADGVPERQARRQAEREWDRLDEEITEVEGDWAALSQRLDRAYAREREAEISRLEHDRRVLEESVGSPEVLRAFAVLAALQDQAGSIAEGVRAAVKHRHGGQAVWDDRTRALVLDASLAGLVRWALQLYETSGQRSTT
jgi:chromosome segregation ATPase